MMRLTMMRLTMMRLTMMRLVAIGHANAAGKHDPHPDGGVIGWTDLVDPLDATPADAVADRVHEHTPR